jgi:xylulokinase
MALFIGVDVGTSGLEAIAVDAERGGLVAAAHRSYPLSTPHPGWAEQEPEDFVEAALDALRELATALGRRAGEVRGLGLTGQMHSAVLLDRDGALVRPAILWCDGRTTAECRAIVAAVGQEGLRRMAGNRALEGFTLPKLLWLREHEPERYARIERVVMPKDYVTLHLTGVLATDVTDASGTLGFDPGARAFSDELLRAVDVPRSFFPDAGESAAALGALTATAARETGLPEGILVVHGAADNAAAAVGLGVVRPGRAMASIGTSGVVLAYSDAYAVEPSMRLHSFAHAIAGRYYQMGVMLSAGGALRWYRDVLCDGERIAAEVRAVDPYEILTEAASTAPAGARGVIFLPYLMGERTPHEDALARGAFVGLTARTTKAEISRAVLEGITLGLADLLELVRQSPDSAPIAELRVTGGGARSTFWRQLMADVLDVDVLLTTSTEGPAFGAAILAMVGAGVYASVEEASDALVHVVSRARPDPVAAARYRAVHDVYRALYPALRGAMHALARLE